jgi:DNA-binding response OmpR family regulator
MGSIEKDLILVIEDEIDLREIISRSLRREGYEVMSSDRGDDGLLLAREQQPDLIILDLMLPGLNGTEVCRSLRRDSQVPILMVTALGGESDRVAGLEIGADDYLAKPFGMRELLARIRALLRRSQVERRTFPDDFTSADEKGFVINNDRHEILLAGKPLLLKPREYALLKFFLENPGQVFSRQQLLDSVWDTNFRSDVRTVDVHVRWLRQKVEENSEDPQRICTIRGSGYLFRK